MRRKLGWLRRAGISEFGLEIILVASIVATLVLIAIGIIKGN